MAGADDARTTSLDTRFGADADVRRGIAWMLLAGFLFSTQDTIAKFLSQTYPLIEVLWIRFVIPFLVVLVVCHRNLKNVAASNRLGLQLLRSLLVFLMLGFLFTAYRFLPLADATAMFYFAPILVAALSVPVLGEKVGPKLWVAIVIGFAGVLLVLRPGAGVMHLASLLALAAAVCAAFQQICLRLLGRRDNAITTLLYTPLVGAVISSVPIAFMWVMPVPLDAGLMICLGLIGVVSQYAIIKAFASAPAATVAPFLYAIMLWATAYGYLVFGDLPDWWTVTGAVIIAGSGLYVLRHEKRAPPVALDPPRA